MKLPSPFVLPPRASPARLPFVLASLLAGMVVLQLALPQRIELPPAGSVARVGLAARAQVPVPVIAPGAPGMRNPFAPPARPAGTAVSTDPLDGAVIQGVIQQGRRRAGIVRLADGTLRYVAVGGIINHWRLVSLDQTQARLTLGRGRTLVVAYGSHATSPGSTGPSPTTESGQ